MDDPVSMPGQPCSREEMLESVLAFTPDCLVLYDLDGRVVFANPASLKPLGLQAEEAHGKTWRELGIPKEVGEPFERRFQEVLKSRQSQTAMEYYPMPTGDLRVLETMLTPMSRQGSPCPYVLNTIRDVSRRHQESEALRKADARMGAILNAIPDLMFVNHRDGTFLDYHCSNPALLAVPPDVFLGRKVKDLFPAHIAQPLMDGYAQALDGGAMHLMTYEMPIHHEIRHFEARIVPSGPDQVLSIIRDVTEQRWALQALKESESRFRALCDNITDSIFWIAVQADGRFIVEGANPAQTVAAGLPESDMLGKTLDQFVPRELAEATEAHYRQCVVAGRPITYEEEVELPSGGPSCWQTVLAPIKDSEGRVVRIVGISRNITEHRQQEAVLRQTQKLESLGILAGGIAHDFNNLLTALLGNLNLAQMQLPEESPAQQLLDSMERTLLRAADLTRQMLAFSGKGRFITKRLNLNEVILDTTEFIKACISKKTQIHYRLAEELPGVEADPDQLQQVLLGLITNASEALQEQEGTVVLRTEGVQLEKQDLQYFHYGQLICPGFYVLLEVSDTGCGISPELFPRIFDPFFSTKQVGRGLGLSALLGILRGHHAGIRVQSQLGQGTCFQVFFPALG